MLKKLKYIKSTPIKSGVEFDVLGWMKKQTWYKENTEYIARYEEYGEYAIYELV